MPSFLGVTFHRSRERVRARITCFCRGLRSVFLKSLQLFRAVDEEEEGHEDEGGGRLPRGEGRRRRRTGGGDESTVGHFHASSERGKTDGQRWVRRRWRSSQQVRRRGSGGHVVGRKAPTFAAVHQSVNSRDSERDESFRTSK